LSGGDLLIFPYQSNIGRTAFGLYTFVKKFLKSFWVAVESRGEVVIAFGLMEYFETKCENCPGLVRLLLFEFAGRMLDVSVSYCCGVS